MFWVFKDLEISQNYFLVYKKPKKVHVKLAAQMDAPVLYFNVLVSMKLPL